MERFIMAGMDYKDSPIEMREKVAFTHSAIEKAYEKIKEDNILKEIVILSTCNRTEIYGICDDLKKGIEYLKNFYKSFFFISEEQVKKYIHFLEEKEVAKHLFEVASGFQSMILGEDQILGQVKNAYEKALEYKSSGKLLNRLFLFSITVAKKIKESTKVSENPLSVSSIGVKLIEKQLGDFKGKKVLVIGLGKMTKIAIQHLLDKEIKEIYVTNRSKTKITDFTKIYPEVIGIDFKERYGYIKKVDAIISCTSAPHFVLYEKEFQKNYEKQPLIILDLAVPRDVEPTISSMEKVQLFQLDHLENIAKSNIEKRKASMEKGKIWINEELERFEEWVEDTKAVEVIKKMQDHFQKSMEKEWKGIESTIEGFQEEKEKIREAFEKMSKSFIHQPMMRLKREKEEKKKYIEVIEKLFDFKGEQG